VTPLSQHAALIAIQGKLQAAGYYGGRLDGDWGPKSDAALDRVIAAAGKAPAPLLAPKPAKLTPADLARAAAALSCTVRQIKTVITVESGGGWFADVRADILALDGPGGFIDGPDLPKILFEAHLFSRLTEGRFDKTHPHLSSPKWNRSLYKGGQAEYARLYEAMSLDETAALKAASWAMFQILGQNHKAAGFPTVQAFVAAMKAGEGAHLDAFVAFVKNSGLAAKLRAISAASKACEPFAIAYNGPAAKTHDYPGKLARAFKAHAP